MSDSAAITKTIIFVVALVSATLSWAVWVAYRTGSPKNRKNKNSSRKYQEYVGTTTGSSTNILEMGSSTQPEFDPYSSLKYFPYFQPDSKSDLSLQTYLPTLPQPAFLGWVPSSPSPPSPLHLQSLDVIKSPIVVSHGLPRVEEHSGSPRQVWPPLSPIEHPSLHGTLAEVGSIIPLNQGMDSPTHKLAQMSVSFDPSHFSMGMGINMPAYIPLQRQCESPLATLRETSNPFATPGKGKARIQSPSFRPLPTPPFAKGDHISHTAPPVSAPMASSIGTFKTISSPLLTPTPAISTIGLPAPLFNVSPFTTCTLETPPVLTTPSLVLTSPSLRIVPGSPPAEVEMTDKKNETFWSDILQLDEYETEEERGDLDGNSDTSTHGAGDIDSTMNIEVLDEFPTPPSPKIEKRISVGLGLTLPLEVFPKAEEKTDARIPEEIEITIQQLPEFPSQTAQKYPLGPPPESPLPPIPSLPDRRRNAMLPHVALGSQVIHDAIALRPISYTFDYENDGTVFDYKAFRERLRAFLRDMEEQQRRGEGFDGLELEKCRRISLELEMELGGSERNSLEKERGSLLGRENTLKNGKEVSSPTRRGKSRKEQKPRNRRKSSQKENVPAPRPTSQFLQPEAMSDYLRRKRSGTISVMGAVGNLVGFDIDVVSGTGKYVPEILCKDSAVESSANAKLSLGSTSTLPEKGLESVVPPPATVTANSTIQSHALNPISEIITDLARPEGIVQTTHEAIFTDSPSIVTPSSPISITPTPNTSNTTSVSESVSATASSSDILALSTLDTTTSTMTSSPQALSSPATTPTLPGIQSSPVRGAVDLFKASDTVERLTATRWHASPLLASGTVERLRGRFEPEERILRHRHTRSTSHVV